MLLVSGPSWAGVNVQSSMHKDESACAENAEGSAEDEGMPGREYKRGLAPYVFVPWEHIQDSPLNLPVAKMDFYVPG